MLRIKGFVFCLLMFTTSSVCLAGDFYSFKKDNAEAAKKSHDTASVLSKEQMIMVENAQQARMEYLQNKANKPVPNQAFIFIDENSLSNIPEAELMIQQMRREKGDVAAVLSVHRMGIKDTLNKMQGLTKDKSISWSLDVDYMRAKEFKISTFPAAAIIYKNKKRKLNRWNDLHRVLLKVGSFTNLEKMPFDSIDKFQEQARADALNADR